MLRSAETRHDFGSVSKIAIVTHHKTGTVWLNNVFRKISNKFGIQCKFVNNYSGSTSREMLSSPDRAVFLNGSGKCPVELSGREDALIIHMIRDPRDVLVSGMHYHCNHTPGQTNGSKEPFLHSKRPRLSGKSYQEHLNSLPHEDDKYRFEMRMKHTATLREMTSWDYELANSVEWRYEDLINDTECQRFRSAITPFARDQDELDGMVKVFFANSLFGKSKKTASEGGHVRSGKARQWPKSLSNDILTLYAERHGEDLIRLNYEVDKDWVGKF